MLDDFETNFFGAGFFVSPLPSAFARNFAIALDSGFGDSALAVFAGFDSETVLDFFTAAFFVVLFFLVVFLVVALFAVSVSTTWVDLAMRMVLFGFAANR